MPRPFALHVVRAAPPGELHLDLSFAGPASQDKQDTLKLLLGEVVAFLVCGAGGGPHVDPARVSARPSPPRATDRNASQVLQDVMLDPGAARCLANICEWSHSNLLPLRSARLVWDRLRDGVDPATSPFPERARLAFPVEIDDDRDRRFAIRVELVRDQPETVLQQVNEDIYAWYTAANRGAYGGEPGFPPAVSSLFLSADPVQTLPRQITWFVDSFHCDESALDGLLNTLQRVHALRAAIREVEIS